MSLGRCCWIVLLLVTVGCTSKETPAPVDAGVDAGTPEDAGSPPVCDLGVQHEQGFACNRDADCVSGHCYFAADPFDTSNPVSGYCTTTCDIEATSNPCPSGYDCVPATIADNGECAPYDALPSGGGVFPLGAPCTLDGDCASGSCAAISMSSPLPHRPRSTDL